MLLSEGFLLDKTELLFTNRKVISLVLTFNLTSNHLISPLIMYKRINYSQTPHLNKE